MLDPSTKGLPFCTGGCGRRCRPPGLEHAGGRPSAAARGHSARRAPANSAWMSAFTAENGLVLAPHGKTTMAPQLFALQIADGAWAITVATVQQLEVCRRFGVRRVMMANQPIGRLAVDACFRALRASDGFELYCLADSLAGAALLAEGAARLPPPPGRPLRVLVEIGFPAGAPAPHARGGAGSCPRCRGHAGTRSRGFRVLRGPAVERPTRPTPSSTRSLPLRRQPSDEGLFRDGHP